MSDNLELHHVIEAVLLTAGEPVTVQRIQNCFEEECMPPKEDIFAAIELLQSDYHAAGRTFIIKELASGYVLQVKQELAPFLIKLWEEKPAKYTRAYLETLVIIAYRQPVTRAEIEDIRGVAVSSSIMKTLQERDWIKTVGHREVPGKPALYGTTKVFLDYFNLKSLDELPTLKEVQDLDVMAARLQEELALDIPPVSEESLLDPELAVLIQQEPSSVEELIEVSAEVEVLES